MCSHASISLECNSRSTFWGQRICAILILIILTKCLWQVLFSLMDGIEILISLTPIRLDSSIFFSLLHKTDFNPNLIQKKAAEKRKKKKFDLHFPELKSGPYLKGHDFLYVFRLFSSPLLGLAILYTVSPPCPWILYPWIEPTLDRKYQGTKMCFYSTCTDLLFSLCPKQQLCMYIHTVLGITSNTW